MSTHNLKLSVSSCLLWVQDGLLRHLYVVPHVSLQEREKRSMHYVRDPNSLSSSQWQQLPFLWHQWCVPHPMSAVPNMCRLHNVYVLNTIYVHSVHHQHHLLTCICSAHKYESHECSGFTLMQLVKLTITTSSLTREIILSLNKLKNHHCLVVLSTQTSKAEET